MIEPAIPEKETVRITLPTRCPAETDVEHGDGGRINSLIRPTNDIVASRVVPRSDPKPLWARGGGTQPETETSRIGVLPMPTKASARFLATVRSSVHDRAVIDAVPKPLCWALVGISAVLFLVEIWNYIS
jgi:hypothetical protein